MVTLAMVATALGIVWMLGPGAPWALEHIDGVHGLQGEKLASALDAIRGRVLAVATGMAALVAVYYTARNADTARRSFQLGERGHDTDRYGKAVEQLGNEQALVRLGGLYALEQLAQNNPALRQTIVDVICAYLRMPYNMPEETARHEKIRASRRAARAGAPGRNIVSESDDLREEREVRLTAQRILHRHMRDPSAGKTPRTDLIGRPDKRWRRPWQRSTESTSLFWPNTHLDLTGATLLDLDFAGCNIGGARFAGAAFYGTTYFYDTIFNERAEFADTSFHGFASFPRAAFKGPGYFHRATFHSACSFTETIFHNGLIMIGATFNGNADFSEAIFLSTAIFKNTTQGTGHINLEGARPAPSLPPDIRPYDWPPGWEIRHEPNGEGRLQASLTRGREPDETAQGAS